MSIQSAIAVQRAEIAAHINDATDVCHLRRARLLIEHNVLLWTALGRLETLEELKAAAVAKARVLIEDETQFLANERKNSRVRASTEKHIDDLKDLVETLR